jgi:hypothetical protein
MAYDEGLAERVREQLAAEPGLTEKAMFGGVAFLLDGTMAVALMGDELMVRVGRDEARGEALARPHTRPSEMKGRPMRGWVLVAPEGLEDDADIASWVGRGAAVARSLPAKA